MTAAIKLSDVSFTYEGSPAPTLKSISLEVNEGEVAAIVGPSEAGKTTLCMTLNGLIPHEFRGEFKGSVEIRGMNTRAFQPYQFASIVGMVFQDPESQFVMTSVEDEIAFGLENLGVPTDEIEERLSWVLRVTRLQGLEKKHPRALSGGQKQRVAIASAFALEPKILVLDEPTSELDPVGKMEVLNLVTELNREHKITIVLVEHETEMLAEMSDKVFLLNGGRLELEAEPRRFFSEASLLRERGLFVPQVAEISSLVTGGARVSVTYEETKRLLEEEFRSG